MKSKKLLLSSLCFVSSIVSVNAHGYLSALIIAGKEYKGDVPNSSPDPSIIRQVGDISPVQPATSPSLNCGLNAKLAQLVADANPGDLLQFVWRGGDNQNWPHNTGPMLTYMTSCGSTPCNQFNSSNAKWFKIQQVGRQPTGNHDWVQVLIMQGASANVSLPKNIAPGNYLIRHEIIALHNGGSEGGAEFYPACSQVRIGGSGSGAPQDNELCTFPGAYSQDEPGIWDKNAYDPNAQYPFPGPPIATFVDDSGSGSESGSKSLATTVKATATKTGTSSPSSKKSSSPTRSPSPQSLNISSSSRVIQCKLRKSSSGDEQQVALSSRSNSIFARSRKDLSLALRGLFSPLTLFETGSFNADLELGAFSVVEW